MVVNSLTVGGAERHTVDLASDLEQAGDEVHIAYLAQRHDLLDCLPLPVRQRAVCIPRAGPLDIAAVHRLARLRASVQPDVVLTVNQYPQVMQRWSAAFGRGAPVVNVQHSMANPDDSPLKLAVGRSALRAADALVYLSPSQQSYWRARGLTGRREVVIPNGVDLERFRPASARRRAAARASIGARDDELVIGVCAGLRPEKRHETLLHAAAQLARDGLPLRLLLIGDGPRRPALMQLAQDLGLACQLHITGFVLDVTQPLAACDLVCLTSTHETLPLALLEAQAMALPVVASRIGATEDIVDDSVSGFLVSPEDAGLLARRLSRLADPVLRMRMGEAGRRSVCARFDRRQMTAAYRSLLAQLAQRRARREAA
jgi:glycosyltransferase involved in cell wall biosynthesis